MNGATEDIREQAPLNLLDRETVYNAGNYVADYKPPLRESGVVRHGPVRETVQLFSFAGVHSWQNWTNLWQGFALDAPHEAAGAYRDYSSPNMLATRLWAVDIRARQPIPVSQYYTDPAQLMPGNARATNPQMR